MAGNREDGGYNRVYTEITEAVLETMMKTKSINKPEFKSFYNDQGIFHAIVTQHCTREEYKLLRDNDEQIYLNVCGMHAFGAGLYIAALQIKWNKPVSKFNIDDLKEIAQHFGEADLYELGLMAVGVAPTSNNKYVFDKIILAAIQRLKDFTGKNASNPENVRMFMQALYNAGVTIVLRE